ncbi:hypothetical protein COLO4_02700 [Corchorus olitorius]|uniref:Uncharacterized protein n=1 Tax=Corchorus olitorius TaxID=93759 RepID=A0A1R3L0K7_9ROSI|nr:hypothetical protein COLO4_02700 [Corchorus olitorius]
MLLVISLSMVRKNVLKLYLKKKLIINLISIAPPFLLDIIPRCTLQSRCGHPRLCCLLLSHGAQPNIRSRVVDSEIFHNKLPLNCVFDGLMDSVYLQGWPTFDPADHIFRVIIKLCLPEVSKLRKKSLAMPLKEKLSR